MTNNAIAKILKDIQSKGMVATTLTDPDSPCHVSERISSGCVALDAIMGGGFPVGRVTEIYGDPSSGKSLIAAVAAGLAQQSHAIVAYEDTETTVSQEMMSVLGVDVDNLIYDSADTIEEVFNFFDLMVDSRNKNAADDLLFLIWDSVAATSIQLEMDKDTGSSVMGRHALYMSQGLRKFTHVIANQRVCCLILNQVRQKIGIMFGDSTATFGGKALEFHSSVRVKLDLAGKIRTTDKKHVIGMMTVATCTKNKTSMPFRQAKLPIFFGSGIDDAMATFYYMKDNNLMKSSGANYTIQLVDGELTFTKKQWRKVFDDYYQNITDLVLSDNPELDGSSAEM